ncbi:MAG TPA: hypothetical protein VL119_05080 [Acidimicrobiia bacterium]|nr:hypothetical protein [Acidimicrobiia bacterium]
MDAINSLLAGTRRAEATVDATADRLAGADLPTAAEPDPTNPSSPSSPRSQDVDVADQLVTMNVAADMHHVTTAALRSAFSLYRDSLELIAPEPIAPEPTAR